MNRPHLLCSTLILASVASAQAADVTIHVSQISEPTGLLHWALFDSAEAFDEGGLPVISARSKVADSTLSTTVHGLPPGRYAVRLFHDSNGNGELDRNMLGIPSEGYGFSNNAGSRGPASFEDAAVEVQSDTTIEVPVR